MPVSVRLAAVAAALTAVTGCMSVADHESGGSRPSHSAGRGGGAVPEDAAVSGG
ncbi:hypothetical protein G3I35_39795, partial [Streptomyces sp. SID10815]|nr:hypothetical protein [Streptomyces sp. SID10815]